MKRLKNKFYKILFPLERSDLYKSLILFLTVLLTTFLELIGISLIIPILTIFTGNDYLEYIKYLPFQDNNSKEEVLILILILFSIIYFIKFLTMGFLAFFQSAFSYSIYYRVACKLFKKYLSQNYIFHLKSNSSELIRNLTSECNLYSFGVVYPLIKLISEIIIFISIISLLFYYNLIASSLSVFFFSISGLLIYKATSFSLKSLGEKRFVHSAGMLKQINQGLGVIKEIIIYKLNNFFSNQFKEHVLLYSKASRMRDIIVEFPRLILEFLVVIIFVVTIYIFLKQGKNISEIFVIIGVFAYASVRLLPSIVKIIKSFQTIKYNFPVMDLIYNELNLPNNHINELPIDQKNDFNFKKLEFKNVGFSYFTLDKKKKIFENLNIEINEGDKIGICGPTGAGKTTLINLLLGLLNPTEGNFLINSEKVENNLSHFQNKIGYVPQQVYLADESLIFNIALDEKNNADIEFIQKIIDTLDLSELINSFPNKLETKVGERGSRISGGQLQRLGIARALYRKPSILILDEATNSLDQDIEQKIIKSVFNNDLVKTIISISHRESSFEYCNKIFQVENNKLKKL